MDFLIRKGDLIKEKADLLVLSALEGFEKFGGATAEVDKAVGGYLLAVAKEDQFKGRLGQTILVRANGPIAAKRVLIVGLGKKEDLCEESIREAAAVSYHEAERLGAKVVVSVLHGAGYGKIAPKLCGKAIVEGVLLSGYKFDAYRKKKNQPTVKTFAVVSRNVRTVAQADVGAKVGALGVEGTIFARNLVNTPSAHMHPSELVKLAEGIAKESKGKIKIKVMNKAACEKLGMGAFLGIAQGSDHPPYFVHLSYRPTDVKKHISLVGKAITFDSGGLSIKPAEGMYTMKLDMAGSAAVLGVFKVLTRLQPKIAVDGIFAACENMPSGKAIRPGDIVKAMNGTTIEVLHTDAEGRVTLADALSFAVTQKPDAIIDLATLTGACMVALGDEISGVMSNDAKFENKILAASTEAGEKMWSLPLEKNYKREIKSEVADLRNIAGRWGGAVTAGLFLQEFVNEIPWAHLDIAGPSFAERPFNAYTGKGGTGVGVRTLIELLRTF